MQIRCRERHYSRHRTGREPRENFCMYECSQCGAQLRFDIQTQLLHCDHCGADFNPETFQPKDAAEESKDAYGVTVFRCRQCGAELVSTTNSAVGFCIYCGAQNMLESRLETRNRPARIIPFHLTKDDCREVYRKKIRMHFMHRANCAIRKSLRNSAESMSRTGYTMQTSTKAYRSPRPNRCRMGITSSTVIIR